MVVCIVGLNTTQPLFPKVVFGFKPLNTMVVKVLGYEREIYLTLPGYSSE